MRLPFLIIVLATPLLAVAQARKPVRNDELVLNLGSAANSDGGPRGFGQPFDVPVRGSIGVIHNRGRFQYGLKIEGGAEVSMQWYAAPSLTGNYRFRNRTGYYYAGASAGYFLNHNPRSGSSSPNAHGYQVGAQGGYTVLLGSRFGLNIDLGVRYVTIRERYNYEIRTFTPPYTAGYTEVYDRKYFLIPATLGIRYRL